MPIYEYRCEEGHSFDVMQRMSDDPLTSCETCGAPAQRVLHAPAVHFKGKGFYNTDYGTKKRQRELSAAADGGSSSSGDGGSSESSSDSKGSGSEKSEKTEKTSESKPSSSDGASSSSSSSAKEKTASKS